MPLLRDLDLLPALLESKDLLWLPRPLPFFDYDLDLMRSLTMMLIASLASSMGDSVADPTRWGAYLSLTISRFLRGCRQGCSERAFVLKRRRSLHRCEWESTLREGSGFWWGFLSGCMLPIEGALFSP